MLSPFFAVNARFSADQGDQTVLVSAPAENRFELVLQADFNLVVYQINKDARTAVASSGTHRGAQAQWAWPEDAGATLAGATLEVDQGKLRLCYRAPGGAVDELVAFREQAAAASLSTPPPGAPGGSTVLFLDTAGALHLMLLTPEELARNLEHGQMNHVAQFLRAAGSVDLAALAPPAARVPTQLASIPPRAQEFALLGSGAYPTLPAFLQAVGATGGAYPPAPGRSLAMELKAWLERPGGARLNLLVERQPTLEQGAYQEVQALLDFIRGDEAQAALEVDGETVTVTKARPPSMYAINELKPARTDDGEIEWASAAVQLLTRDARYAPPDKAGIRQSPGATQGVRYWWVTSATIGPNSEYWQTVRQGAQDSAQDFAAHLSEYKFFSTDSDDELGRVQQQIQVLQAALAQRVDVVTTTCVLGEDEADGLGTQLVGAIRALLDAGTVVLTADTSNIRDARIGTFFGPDAKDLGSKVATTARDKGCTNAIIVIVDNPWGALRLKRQGVLSVFPDARVVTLPLADTAEQQQAAVQGALDAQAADGATALIYVQLNGLEPGVRAVREYGQGVKVFSTDRGASTETLASDITYAVGFNQYWIGYSPLSWALSMRRYPGSRKPFTGGNNTSFSVSLSTLDNDFDIYLANNAGGKRFLLQQDNVLEVGVAGGWLELVGQPTDTVFNASFDGISYTWEQQRYLPRKVLYQGNTNLCVAYSLAQLLTYAHARTEGAPVPHLNPAGIGLDWRPQGESLRPITYQTETGRQFNSGGGCGVPLVSIDNGELDPLCILAWLRRQGETRQFPVLGRAYTTTGNRQLSPQGPVTGVDTSTKLLVVPAVGSVLDAASIRAVARQWMALLTYGPALVRVSGVFLSNQSSNGAYKSWNRYAASGKYLYRPTDSANYARDEAIYTLTVLFDPARGGRAGKQRLSNLANAGGRWTVTIGNQAPISNVEVHNGTRYWTRDDVMVANLTLRSADTANVRAFAVGDTIRFTGGEMPGLYAASTFQGTIYDSDDPALDSVNVKYRRDDYIQKNAAGVVRAADSSQVFGHVMLAVGVRWYGARPYLVVKNSWSANWGTDSHGERQGRGQNGYILMDMWSVEEGYGPFRMYGDGATTLRGAFNAQPILPRRMAPARLAAPPIVGYSAAENNAITVVVDLSQDAAAWGELVSSVEWEIAGAGYISNSFSAERIGVARFSLTGTAPYLVPQGAASKQYTFRLTITDATHSSRSTRETTLTVTNPGYVPPPPPPQLDPPSVEESDTTLDMSGTGALSLTMDVDLNRNCDRVDVEVQAVPAQTFVVTVGAAAQGNAFYVDGRPRPALPLVQGFAYTFDVSDSSMVGHPLEFIGRGGVFNTVAEGALGTAGATVTLTLPATGPAPSDYRCAIHGAAMGNRTEISQVTVVAQASWDASGLYIRETIDFTPEQSRAIQAAPQKQVALPPSLRNTEVRYPPGGYSQTGATAATQLGAASVRVRARQHVGNQVSDWDVAIVTTDAKAGQLRAPLEAGAQYNNNEDTWWMLDSGEPVTYSRNAYGQVTVNQISAITFAELDLETYYDYVYIFKRRTDTPGDVYELVKKITGTVKPEDISGKGRYFIWLKTDYSVTRDGFRIVYHT